MSRFERKNKDRSGWLDLLTIPDGEGLLVLLGAIVAFAVGWVAVDFLFPIAILATYLLIVAALRRVANDRHDCEGNARRALVWGALWATVYTAPLGIFVWILHALAK